MIIFELIPWRVQWTSDTVFSEASWHLTGSGYKNFEEIVGGVQHLSRTSHGAPAMTHLIASTSATFPRFFFFMGSLVAAKPHKSLIVIGYLLRNKPAKISVGIIQLLDVNGPIAAQQQLGSVAAPATAMGIAIQVQALHATDTPGAQADYKSFRIQSLKDHIQSFCALPGYFMIFPHLKLQFFFETKTVTVGVPFSSLFQGTVAWRFRALETPRCPCRCQWRGPPTNAQRSDWGPQPTIAIPHGQYIHVAVARKGKAHGSISESRHPCAAKWPDCVYAPRKHWGAPGAVAASHRGTMMPMATTATVKKII